MNEMETVNIKEFYPGALVSHDWGNNILDCKSDNGVLLRVEVYTDDIIRIRYGTEGFFYPDFSYAIDEKFEKSVSTATLVDHPDYLSLRTATVLSLIHI